MNVKSRLHLAKSSQCLHPVIYQLRCHGVETPDFGVQWLHHLLVVGMGLSNSREDPGLDFLGDYALHNGFQFWFLQAEVRKDETLL